ncbi:GntR family transcriptional regulator [Virgisporangium aurantiacum]|uniref:GntR family transcriptional regulator n=1 Tax=Virgisporangium aurantiacum TaxID=175570 RepID=A0A8J3Z1E6_9ACTN|nr:GntR family transcriptional regulator [Virgisporangium aurantiacum]GIJ55849.1 GntR family transcriptional regulator [Virgisporangium aurantiacum]
MTESAVSGELASASLVELAVERLSREILSGGSDPGERLIEEQLTRRFGISRAPLREALRLLAQQGLVEHVPRRGVRVATLSDRDVHELYEVRDVLEQHAIRTAFKDDARPDLSGVVAALDAMRAAAERGDRLDIADAHRRFHGAIVVLAGNGQLTATHESVLLKIQLYMALNLRREADSHGGGSGVHRHEHVMAALTAGDPGEIIAALASHGAQTYIS